jgi:hypothetical protein
MELIMSKSIDHRSNIESFRREEEGRIDFIIIFSPMARQPTVGQGLLVVEASRSHSNTPHSAGLFWTSHSPDAETST